MCPLLYTNTSLLTAAVQNMKKIATRLSLLFSYYISNFNDIMYFKLYLQLVNKNPLFFKQGVFQQTEKKSIPNKELTFLIMNYEL